MNISALFVILEKQDELLSELIELVEEKRKILVNSEMDKLEALVKKEQQAHRKVVEMEQQIKSWQFENAPNMKIRDIAKNCNVLDAKKLTDIRKKILEKAEHVQKINECNFILIKYNLDFIDFSFKTISGIKDNNKMYNQKNSFHVSGDFNICNMRA